MASFKDLYLNRRVALMLPLGFASGLPLALTGDTLIAWAKDSGQDLKTLGLFSLLGLPYTFKFIWAALLDRYAPPILDRRRSWMLSFQLLLVLAISLMGFCNPATSLAPLLGLALCVSLFSASQDIAVDAYRTDILTDAQRGSGAAVFVGGYRLGMVISGALALILADHGFTWHQIYGLMSLCLGLGIVATLCAEPSPRHIAAPLSLQDAIVNPLRQILTRRGWVVTLLFIILFKLPDVAAAGMTTAFLMDVGIPKSEIGTIRQIIGLVLSIFGALAGGAIVGQVGLRKSLWIFGLLQAISNAGFLLLTQHPHHYPLLVAVIGFESFCAGLVTAGFFAFLMSQCDRRYSAFQYALLSSVMTLTRSITGPISAPLAQSYGWPTFFLCTLVSALPGLALLPFLNTTPAPAPSADRKLDECSVSET